MFGRTLFNKTRYNVTPPFMGMYVNVQVWYTAEVEQPSARVDIGSVNMGAAYAAESGRLYVYTPLPGAEIESEFSMESVLGLKMPIGDVSIYVVTTVSAPALKNNVTEEFNLENILLAPGDTLIIDTDLLEIQLNDENMLESWVTGGVFFQLKPGTNIIQIDTNPAACDLYVTIIWADRYL